MKVDIIASEVVASGLLGLADDGFWDPHTRRELLWTLRARWPDFSSDSRSKLEQRLLNGPNKWRSEEAEEYEHRRTQESAKCLEWIQTQGRELSDSTVDRLERLKKTIPGWGDSMTEGADQSLETRSGWIQTDTNYERLLEEPIPEVIETAGQLRKRIVGSFVNVDPFEGLVKERPRRALLAVAAEARKGKHPHVFWQRLLTSWPTDAPGRITWVLAQRLSQLPAVSIVQLRYEIGRWLSSHLPIIAAPAFSRLWTPWDVVFSALENAGEDATRSGVGEFGVDNASQQRSRRSYTHAINAPIGDLATCLVTILSARQPAKKSRIPADFRARLEQTLNALGEGAHHARSILSHQLVWLDWVDPDWTEEFLIHGFNPRKDAAEAAWSGFLVAGQWPAPSLFGRLKDYFLGAFESDSLASIDRRNLSQMLVLATYSRRGGKRLVSFRDARRALQFADEQIRVDALGQLRHELAEPGAWKSRVKPFLSHAWPKELKYRTSKISRSLAYIAASAGEDFPDAVELVSPLLSSAQEIDMIIYSLAKEDDGARGRPIVSAFPKATVELIDRLLPENPALIPYELTEIVQMAAEADSTLHQDKRWQRLRDLSRN